MLAYALNNLAFDFKRALNCAALSNAAAATAALGKPGCVRVGPAGSGPTGSPEPACAGRPRQSAGASRASRGFVSEGRAKGSDRGALAHARSTASLPASAGRIGPARGHAGLHDTAREWE
jgi:hypothetical protein